MIYVKRIVIADITRQIGLIQKVSDKFFGFDPSMSYERHLMFTNTRGSLYSGYIKKTGHSITITGDISIYVRDFCDYNDIIIFKHSSQPNEYKFIVAKKGTTLYAMCDRLLQRYGTRNGSISCTTHLLTTNSEIESHF